MDEMSVSYNFGHGFVQNARIARVVSQFDELVNYGSKCSSLMMWNKKTGSWHHFNLGWTAIRIVCSETQMFALGAEGDFLRADKRGVREGFIDKSDQGPKARGDLCDMCIIGDHVYVVGKGSQVWRREGDKSWVIRETGLDSSDVGFRSVHGLIESDFYAVGDGGQIWRCVDGKWRVLESPTDKNLNSVKVVEQGLAYAVGEDGVILLGKGDKWEIIAQGATDKVLFGVERFNGKLFLASEESLFVLDDDSQLKDVHVAMGPCWTFKYLQAKEGVLWSFGKEHIFRTEDGDNWQNLSPSGTFFDASEGGGPTASISSCGCSHTGAAHKCD